MDNDSLYSSLLPLTSQVDATNISGAPNSTGSNFMNAQLPVTTQFGVPAQTAPNSDNDKMRQALAKMLMEQGNSPSSTQYTNGFAVKQSGVEDLSKLMSSIAGMYMANNSGGS